MRAYNMEMTEEIKDLGVSYTTILLLAINTMQP